MAVGSDYCTISDLFGGYCCYRSFSVGDTHETRVHVGDVEPDVGVALVAPQVIVPAVHAEVHIAERCRGIGSAD